MSKNSNSGSLMTCILSLKPIVEGETQLLEKVILSPNTHGVATVNPNTYKMMVSVIGIIFKFFLNKRLVSLI